MFCEVAIIAHGRRKHFIIIPAAHAMPRISKLFYCMFLFFLCKYLGQLLVNKQGYTQFNFYKLFSV